MYNLRRYEDEVARPGVDLALELRAEAEASPAAAEVDLALDRAVVVRAGDVGRAIPVRTDEIADMQAAGYRLILKEPFGATLQRRETSDWHDQYAYSLEPVLAADIQLGNHYTSTSPDVHFTQRRITTLAHPRGRSDLLNMELTLTRDGQKESRTLSGGGEYMAALREHFGIELDADFADFK